MSESLPDTVNQLKPCRANIPTRKMTAYYRATTVPIEVSAGMLELVF
jgi:hypothetical protein